jgi:hypothetical protein
MSAALDWPVGEFGSSNMSRFHLCGQGVHRSLSARFIDGMSIGVSQPKSLRLTAPQIRARKGKEKIVGPDSAQRAMATLLDPFVDLTLAED